MKLIKIIIPIIYKLKYNYILFLPKILNKSKIFILIYIIYINTNTFY